MPNVRLPDGRVAKFPDDMPKEEIKAFIAKKFPEATPKAAPEGRDGSGFFEKVDAGVRGAADMITLGMADEISAGIPTGFGLWGDYDKALARERGIDRFDEENNAAARITGQVAGGLGGGLGMAKSGATLIGRSVPGLSKAAPRATATGLAALEGAGYGAGYGFGSGEGIEDRTRQAQVGGATGAVTGAVVQKAGNAIASRLARRQASKMAPALDELTNARRALYDQSQAAGVQIKKTPVNILKQNLKIVAGNKNKRLRPQTAGMLKDIETMIPDGPMSLEALDEFRKGINEALKTAKPQDARVLGNMKKVIDGFTDKLGASHLSGDIRGIEFLKQARALNAREAKVQTIERILDQADVNATGKFTQSGMANAIRQEMKSLYKRIKTGKERGFTKEETELIRKMASGKTSGAIMRLFGKFAPRGVISAGAGSALGSMAGVGPFVGPAVGHMAAQGVDSAMIGAASNLKNAAAAGVAPVLPQIAKGTTPFILPGAEMATGLANRRIGAQ